MRRLVCACVVRNPPKTGFLASRPISKAVMLVAVILSILFIRILECPVISLPSVKMAELAIGVHVSECTVLYKSSST